MDEEKNKREELEKNVSGDDHIEKYNEEEVEQHEKDKEENHDEKKDENIINNNKTGINKKRNIIIGSIVIGILLLVIFINVFVSRYENIVFPGVTIYEENVSRLSKEELNKKLGEIQNKIDKSNILVKANGKNYYIRLNDIILEYNTNELSNEIINYKKNENVFNKFSQIIMKKNKEFIYSFKLNDDKLKDLAKKISKETNKAIKEPQVIINEGKITYEEGENGLILDEKIFKDEVHKALSQEDVVSGEVSIEAKYKIDKPTIELDDLKKVNENISIYSTTYSPGGGRGSNVENATKKLDNMIIMPGQEFSYEKSVGPVEQNNGYTYAPVISNGEMVQGIGGGVCQVSSTLYNTMLKAGILPTERRNHSKAVSYVPRGLDATLASGSIDYKFENTFDYPIVINTYCSGGKLTIEFWSNKEALKGIEYKPVSYASGNVANAYLYGYDKNGKKVYEKHIDTSVYR